MKKKFSLILLAVLLVLVMATCVACGDPDEPTVPDTPAGPTGVTVTFDLQDGSTPITQVFEPGSTVTFPTVENTEYATLRGWYKDAAGKSPWLKSYTVDADVTIYAVWNYATAKVTFNLNYPGAAKAKSENQNKGFAVTLPEDPTRECYTFKGWFTDAEATNAYDVDALLTGALTLYAGWDLEAGHVHEYTSTVYDVTCETDGYTEYTCKCGDSYTEDVIPALGHDFDLSGDEYFRMIACSHEGCESAMRKDSLNIYEDDFVYNFDDAKAAEIDARYQSMVDILTTVDRYDAALHGYVKDSALWNENKAFEEIYNAFYDDLMYLIEQYQYSYVFYCVNENTATTEAYETISEYRTNAVSDFYALYRLIYETKFREYFFAEDEGWTPEDIQEALLLSDSYGGEDYAEINNRISEIEVEFRALSSVNDTTNDKGKVEELNPMLGLYEEFVSLQNQLAAIAGYDNYIDYAYANVYNRDYTPEDVAEMRALVKEYMPAVYKNIMFGYFDTQEESFDSNSLAGKYHRALTSSSVFNTKLTTDLVADYLSTMNTTASKTDIDFYKHCNDLFKNGNYYTGLYEGAFSYWIGAQDTSILYFGPGSYSGAFTFVHEYGHYYNGVYNGGAGMSYDLDETHSQGNEMMFLAWLEDNLPKEVLAEIYDNLYYDNLWNMLAIVMLATAVDEFEYCVYTGTDPDGNAKTYTAETYQSLFNEIMESYGIDGSLNPNYWRYVVIESPCYYISYAMSALPCIGLLSVADNDFEAAQEQYFKLFYFTDDEDNVYIDSVGDVMIEIGYADTLHYCGMSSPFDEVFYQNLNDYFVKNAKDFDYSTEA